MRRILEILGSSLRLTWQEFRSHKGRTLLSLSGVAFGIFCIIAVLATIDSMEYAIQNEIKAFGNKTIYIDKWEYSEGDDQFPWWKYYKRPEPSYYETKLLKERIKSAENIAFVIRTFENSIEYEQDLVTGINYYGVTADFANIQPVDIHEGRYLQSSDYDYSSDVVVMGYTAAETLFGKAQNAVGKSIKLKGGKRATIIGLIKKQGQSLLGGWEYDKTIIMPVGFMKQMFRERYSNPIIMAQAKKEVAMAQLNDELTGAMRSIRKLRPTQADDFSLNDIDAFSSFFADIFSGVNTGGWAIASLSLVVGMFGVANIMFVTVRERTSQIGLKKAIGAKRSTILTEFLLESAFLCIMGGILGLVAVYILTAIFSAMFPFTVFIAFDILLLAIGICIAVGVLAGVIPAIIAARMDPVVAIRSK